MRVIVCGGRDYTDWDYVCATLDELRDVTHLAEGGAPGADSLAAAWCEKHPQTLHYTYPADWKRYGSSAEPIRNQLMLSQFKPDLVVAFPGVGTADMTHKAVAAGVRVILA
jgi:hypothetical protein